MPNRLTRITTKSGDSGQSRLASGDAMPKEDAVFQALGAVDELNSAIGCALAGFPDPASAAGAQLRDIAASLQDVQSRLFDLGGALAMPDTPVSLSEEVEKLHRIAQSANAGLEPLKNFILPGGSACGAMLHLARAICRRAERDVWALLTERGSHYDRSLGVYLNRLGDALFIFARCVNKAAGESEPLWQPLPRSDTAS
jgi:cob(I)alamin adenosyltransferase